VLLPWVWRGLSDVPEAVPALRVLEHEPEAALAALRRLEADIAVIHAYSLLPRDVPPGCEQHHLAAEPVVLVIGPEVAARHGLALGQPVEMARLSAEEWLMPGPETACHELTRRACGAAGFVPHPVALASDFSVLTALAAADAGVALVPWMALPTDPGDVRVHPLAEPVSRTISAVTRSGESRQPHVALVLGALRAASRDA
jgi:DNA-binding transcriptional LysR family regulator